MAIDLKRLTNVLRRDAFTIEDETKPTSSPVNQILLSTIFDQVYEDENGTKNLTQVLEELRWEIKTGGLGNIVFPVTSVNGKTGDVILTKNDLGLGRVDNTADVDKPLSTPQREAIMNILQHYDFNISLQELYDHLVDMNNPHQVTVDQLDLNGSLEAFVKRLIALHNYSTEHTVHIDIRRSLATLWELVETIQDGIDTKIADTIDSYDDHYTDPLAHEELMKLKEDIANKVKLFSKVLNNDHTKYPSTKAVVEFVESKLVEFNETLPDVENWIDDIQVVDTRNNLPTPSSKYYRKAYFIRRGIDSHSEVAICRLSNNQTTYSWDISTMGDYTLFDARYFEDSINGLTLRMVEIVKALLADEGAFREVLESIFKNYYTRDEIDKFHYVDEIKILPGTELGTIRYYINGDMTTMSEDVKVNGLHRLAYLEWITEKEIWDNSIRSNHIYDQQVITRHIKDMNVTPNKISCKYGYLLGNTMNADKEMSHEVTLVDLADALRPLIGGWPDPNTPGGNPYWDNIYEMLIHPHMYTEGVEYSVDDHSYVRRYKGTISQIRNMRTRTPLTTQITSKTHKIYDEGGTWVYQSDPCEMITLGGSNITGHTFSTIVLTEEGLFLETISIGDRLDAPYDVWVRYTKNEEDGTYNRL